jgi:predicted RNase H-like HicB family nuclease
MATIRETFTAVVEFDLETQLYVGFIPELPGAATQGATLDELYTNLSEVAELVLEDLLDSGELAQRSKFIGTHTVTVEVDR